MRGTSIERFFTKVIRVSNAAVALALLLSLGCSDGSPPTGSAICASGHVAGADNGCMAVGIQGCADLFIGEDGLCHPSMAKCPPGTIPRFDEGCIPVGIQRCAPP